MEMPFVLFSSIRISMCRVLAMKGEDYSTNSFPVSSVTSCSHRFRDTYETCMELNQRFKLSKQKMHPKKKRHKIMTMMRNKRTHIHNCNVIREGKGVFIVVYRPTVPDANYQDYGQCEFCYGYYIR